MLEQTPVPGRFKPWRVLDQKAKHTEIYAHGDRREGFNIIRKADIERQTYDFCHCVLNPILKGTDATLVPVLNGAMLFATDIVREIDEASHIEIMSVTARNYGYNRPTGEVYVSKGSIIAQQVENRTVVIIDDLMRTGSTVAEVSRRINEYGPKRIITVFLLRKMINAAPLIQPDFWLFSVHAESRVFGYGIDLDERYRHLRYICDANLDLYQKDGTPRY